MEKDTGHSWSIKTGNRCKREYSKENERNNESEAITSAMELNALSPTHSLLPIIFCFARTAPAIQ
jgi:hypothetical protein